MVKKELIAALAARHTDLKVQDVDRMARLVIEAMNGAIAGGRDIELRGFGSFRIREYQARMARNPRTGDPVELGPRKGLVFRPGRDMKERIND